MLGVCAGPDGRDQYSLPAHPVDYVSGLSDSLKGIRIAWCPDLGYTKAVDPEILAICERAAKRFRRLGCRVETVCPDWANPQASWETIFCGGIAARLKPYLAKHGAEIEPGLRKLVERTMRWKPTTYIDGWFERLVWNAQVQRMFERYAFLLTPTLPCRPFAIGVDHPRRIDGALLKPYEWLGYTFPFNLTGNPVASVPCGLTADRLPVGLQIVGPRFDDVGVLRASAAFEREWPWAQAKPPVS
jgi:aspartyl-tRNA(Asn)/glutamyl-tRNA(Gln) amidotransferase subunit A